MLITHPTSFMKGVRVLILKDIRRVSHDMARFRQNLDELLAMMKPNERIYSTASPRDLSHAYRLFQMQQIDARYDPDPSAFPRRLEDRWHACLMQPESQVSYSKVWMFDCGSEKDFEDTWKQLVDLKVEDLYSYPTKKNIHILCAPFNKRNITLSSHDNPLMLWAYHD